MTNREIDRLVGKNVMGWILSKDGFWSENPYMDFPPKPAWERCDNKYFKPSERIEDAWLVVERVRDSEGHIQLGYIQGLYALLGIRFGKVFTTGEAMALTSPSPIQICIATLYAFTKAPFLPDNATEKETLLALASLGVEVSA